MLKFKTSSAKGPLLCWKTSPEVSFYHRVSPDSGPPRPVEGGGWLWSWGILVLLTTDPTPVSKKKSEVKAVYAELLSRYGMQVGRGRSSIAELADSGFYISTIRATLWLSSTMCSSDSCFSEILGLGKHACYADSRTTNFTHLTSPPSVRRCTASRTRLLPVFCTSCWSASWFILTLFHRFICVCVPFLWPIIFYQLDPIRLNGKVLRYYLTIAVNSYSRNRKAWLDCLEKPWEGKSQHLAAMQMSSPTTSAWHWLCKRVPFKKNNKKDLYIYIFSYIWMRSGRFASASLLPVKLGPWSQQVYINWLQVVSDQSSFSTQCLAQI